MQPQEVNDQNQEAFKNAIFTFNISKSTQTSIFSNEMWKDLVLKYQTDVSDEGATRIVLNVYVVFCGCVGTKIIVIFVDVTSFIAKKGNIDSSPVRYRLLYGNKYPDEYFTKQNLMEHNQFTFSEMKFPAIFSKEHINAVTNCVKFQKMIKRTYPTDACPKDFMFYDSAELVYLRIFGPWSKPTPKNVGFITIEVDTQGSSRYNSLKARPTIQIRGEACTLLAVINNSKILVVKQLRGAAGRAVYELLAGMMDDNGNVVGQMMTEAKEEADLDLLPENIHFLGEFFTSIGLLDELIKMFYTNITLDEETLKKLTMKLNGVEGEEAIKLSLVDLTDTIEIIKMSDSKVSAAVLAYRSLEACDHFKNKENDSSY